LGGLEWDSDFSIAEYDEADLFTYQEFLNYHRQPELGERCIRFRAVLGNDDPLPCR
jgi:hypothetical protein